MKAWTDLNLIAIPDCMKHLPLDSRGYPIPYFGATAPDGTPDFRVVDPDRWVECVTGRKCGITGLPLGYEMAFVGWPNSILGRTFTDAPMIPEAAEYALKACPFLAAPKFGYAAMSSVEKQGGAVRVNPEMSTTRPEVFGMGITRSYLILHHGNSFVLKAAQFRRISYWKHGRHLESMDWSAK